MTPKGTPPTELFDNRNLFPSGSDLLENRSYNWVCARRGIGDLGMKMRLLAGGALILAASLTYSSASTQDASGTKKEEVKAAETPKVTNAPGRRSAKPSSADGKIISPYSLAQRTALNRQDCKPNNLHADGLGMHGQYRTYGQWDPELKSIEYRYRPEYENRSHKRPRLREWPQTLT